MRESKRVRATLQRVPFPGEPGKYLPGPSRAMDPVTKKLRIVAPAQPMRVPWVAYWRQREADGLVEIVPDVALDQSQPAQGEE